MVLPRELPLGPVLALRVRYCGASDRQLLGELRKWLARTQNDVGDPLTDIRTL